MGSARSILLRVGGCLIRCMTAYPWLQGQRHPQNFVPFCRRDARGGCLTNDREQRSIDSGWDTSARRFDANAIRQASKGQLQPATRLAAGQRGAMRCIAPPAIELSNQPFVTIGAGALPTGALPIGALPIGALPTCACWKTGCALGKSAATAQGNNPAQG